MLRATLDTNVLFSALRSQRCAAFELIRLLREGRWRLVLSNATLMEYEEVLKREASLLKLSLFEIDQFLDALCTLAERYEPSGDWDPALPDADDEAFAQLASESRVDALATFNVRHFEPARRRGTPVMTPADFLGMLRKTL